MRTDREGRLPAGAGVALIVAAIALSGCTTRRPSVVDCFPVGSVAAPWILDGQVWSGTFEQAAPALGDHAAQWANPPPQHVWLAVYRHDTDVAQRLTARIFAFESPGAARTMYDRLRPPAATEFQAGDGGRWTDAGVIFVWGQLVIDIFGASPSWPNQVQSAMLANFIMKQMPPGVPEAPL